MFWCRRFGARGTVFPRNDDFARFGSLKVGSEKLGALKGGSFSSGSLVDAAVTGGAYSTGFLLPGSSLPGSTQSGSFQAGSSQVGFFPVGFFPVGSEINGVGTRFFLTAGSVPNVSGAGGSALDSSTEISCASLGSLR